VKVRRSTAYQAKHNEVKCPLSETGAVVWSHLQWVIKARNVLTKEAVSHHLTGTSDLLMRVPMGCRDVSMELRIVLISSASLKLRGSQISE
jgi:hypothetical protein